MSDFRADLHCHTTISDGTCSPKEVVELAASIGLQGLSITDHDCIGAYLEVGDLAKEKGIRLLPGVEFSCVHRGESIHLLAYAFPLDSAFILDFCARHKQRRILRFERILERLAENEVFLPREELFLSVGTMPGRPHIAQSMVAKGYVSDIRAAFKRFLGEGACAYVPSMSYSIEETLDVIRKAGGKAVIAHPILIRKKSIYRDLLSMDFDGLEGNYACFHKSEEAPYLSDAKQRGLFVTGGSDFHGDVKPRIRLGSSWTSEPVFDLLWSHYQEQVP